MMPHLMHATTVLLFPVTGGVLEAVVYGQSSEVILVHMAAGYSCGYGFSYQLWGGVGLQLKVGGEGWRVVWEDNGDTSDTWKQVRLKVSTCNTIIVHMALHPPLLM